MHYYLDKSAFVGDLKRRLAEWTELRGVDFGVQVSVVRTFLTTLGF